MDEIQRLIGIELKEKMIINRNDHGHKETAMKQKREKYSNKVGRQLFNARFKMVRVINTAKLSM